MMKILLWVSLLLLSLPSLAETKFYRYVDDNGNTVINHSIPANKVAGGYDVLNASGQLITTVDRVLTDEEKAARSDEEKAKEQAELEKLKQAKYDLELLRKYSFVADIEAEKERKIREMTVSATILKGNLYGVRSELEAEYKRAAAIEKTGRKVPEETAKRINDLENKITTTKELLKQREQAIEATRKDYLYAISRFKLLQEKRKPK